MPPSSKKPRTPDGLTYAVPCNTNKPSFFDQGVGHFRWANVDCPIQEALHCAATTDRWMERYVLIRLIKNGDQGDTHSEVPR